MQYGRFRTRWRETRDLIRRARATAGENVEFSDATTALFNTYRDELAAFEPDALQYWIKAVDDSLPWP